MKVDPWLVLLNRVRIRLWSWKSNSKKETDCKLCLSVSNNASAMQMQYTEYSPFQFLSVSLTILDNAYISVSSSRYICWLVRYRLAKVQWLHSLYVKGNLLAPNIQAHKFQLAKTYQPLCNQHYLPAESWYVGLCEQNNYRYGHLKKWRKNLSIKNTTANIIFKAHTKLGSLIFDKAGMQ